MRVLMMTLGLVLALISMGSIALAQSVTIDVTVSFRERIALPPDAELELQLLEVSPMAIGPKRIALQRVAIANVPKMVSLHYDLQVIDRQSRHMLVAAIWSGESEIFRAADRYEFGDANQSAPVQMWLAMVSESGAVTVPRRSISGIAWRVTEVGGEPWGAGEPATLAIDDAMNFSVFGGCNRFSGQFVLAEGEIAFPENFAGTLMACSDEAEARERRFIAALRQVSRYVRYGAGLVMTDAVGNALLHFVERPE